MQWTKKKFPDGCEIRKPGLWSDEELEVEHAINHAPTKKKSIAPVHNASADAELNTFLNSLFEIVAETRAA